MSSPGFARGRRLRSTPALRRLTAQTRLAPADFVLPVFVKEGIAGKPHARTVVSVIGPATAASATEFGLRVDVQPETAAVGPLVDALAEFARARRAEAEGEGEK